MVKARFFGSTDTMMSPNSPRLVVVMPRERGEVASRTGERSGRGGWQEMGRGGGRICRCRLPIKPQACGRHPLPAYSAHCIVIVLAVCRAILP
jgi:hypothetical protein